MLAIAVTLTSLTVVFAQVAGTDVGRDIMRRARQKKTGQDATKPARVNTNAITPRNDKPAMIDKPITLIEPVEPVKPNIVEVAAPIAAGDEILNLLPEDCLLCIRINEFDTSLAGLDQYLTGISPIPLSFMAKGALGEMLQDPTLERLNTQGDFAIFAAVASDSNPAAPMPEIRMGIILPIKDPQTAAQIPNATVLSKNYALLQGDSDQIRAALKADMLKSSLAPSLDPDQIKEATTTPAWAYVNIEKAVQLFGPMLFAQLDMASQMVTQAPATPGQPAQTAEMNKKMAAMYIDFVKEYATQIKSLSLNLAPEPDALNLSLTLAAKPNTELAAILQKDPTMKPGYTLAGFLNEPAAINVVVKTNKTLFTKLNDLSMDLFGETLSDIMPGQNTDKWKALAAQSMKNMGNEMAFSFSMAPGMPPVAIKEVIQTEDPAAVIESIGESFLMVNEMYKAMGLPLALAVEPDTKIYKNTVPVYSMKFDVQIPPTATDEEKMIAQAMAMPLSGFKVKFAAARNLMLVTVGPNAEDDIRQLIDQALSPTPQQPSGDIMTALSTIPNADNTDFVASVNIIRLLSGVGEMMKSMPVPAGQMVGDMFAGLDIPTQSCICLAGTVENGSATLQVALPKQHLLELFTVVMKIQQNRAMNNQATSTPLQ